jgi:iron(III) transport system permease protein
MVSVAPPGKSPRPLFSPAALPPWVVFGIVATLVLYPVAMIIFGSFQEAAPGEPSAFGLSAWREVITNPQLLTSVRNTLVLAVVLQGLTFPVGVVISWLLARADIPGGRSLEFMFWIAFFLPTLPVTLGWILMLDPDYGLMNQALASLPFIDRGPFNIYSFEGIVWTHFASHSVAIKVMLLTPVFRNMDSALEEASNVSGASKIG